MEEQIYIVLAVVLLVLLAVLGPIGIGELFVCEFVGVDGLPACS